MEPEPTHVRSAVPDDAPSIAQIHVVTWQAAYRGIVPDDYLDGLSIAARETRWRDIIAKPESDVLVAERLARIVGWAAFGPSRDEGAGPEVGEVYALYVLPECWASGVGSALWQETRMRLVGQGYLRATLWVLAENRRAIRFYLAAGFRPRAGAEALEDIGGQHLLEACYEIALG